MKTRILTPIGLLAGITLSLSPLAATAQEEDRRPSPRMDGERPIQRDQIDRLIDAYLRGNARVEDRQPAKEAVDRREKRMPHEREMQDAAGVPNPGMQRQRFQLELQRRMEMRRDRAPATMRLRDGAGRPQRDRAMAGPQTMRAAKLDGPKSGPQGEAAPRVKVQHLREAAEHLQAAGFPDYAKKARKEADRIIEQVRRESAQDANPELTEKVRQLSREVEELRQQLRRMKAEAAPNPPRHPEERRADAPPEGQVR